MNEDDRRLGASARSRQVHVEHLPLVGAIRDVVRTGRLCSGPARRTSLNRSIITCTCIGTFSPQRGPTVAISAQRSAGIAGKLFPVSFIDYRDRTANNLSQRRMSSHRRLSNRVAHRRIRCNLIGHRSNTRKPRPSPRRRPADCISPRARPTRPRGSSARRDQAMRESPRL